MRVHFRRCQRRCLTALSRDGPENTLKRQDKGGTIGRHRCRHVRALGHDHVDQDTLSRFGLLACLGGRVGCLTGAVAAGQQDGREHKACPRRFQTHFIVHVDRS